MVHAPQVPTLRLPTHQPDLHTWHSLLRQTSMGIRFASTLAVGSCAGVTFAAPEDPGTVVTSSMLYEQNVVQGGFNFAAASPVYPPAAAAIPGEDSIDAGASCLLSGLSASSHATMAGSRTTAFPCDQRLLSDKAPRP